MIHFFCRSGNGVLCTLGVQFTSPKTPVTAAYGARPLTRVPDAKMLGQATKESTSYPVLTMRPRCAEEQDICTLPDSVMNNAQQRAAKHAQEKPTRLYPAMPVL